jgi:hypothetical protein
MGVLSEVVNVTDIRGTCWNIVACLLHMDVWIMWGRIGGLRKQHT